MGDLRRIWTLIVKNLLVTLVRPWLTTPLRAFILPVAFIVFISYAQNLFLPPSHYGIGSPTPVLSFETALSLAGGGRNTVAFVDNGYHGGDIDRVISDLSRTVKSSGREVVVLSSENDLRQTCRSSISAVSGCIAAAVFYSSPTEGQPAGRWNYTLRADGALGEKIDTRSTRNDAEIYLLPFQRAIDWSIARGNSSVDQNLLPNQVMEYPLTSITEDQYQTLIHVRYMGAIINILGIAIFIGIVGVTYQLTGLIASEREQGISQLIDCMTPVPLYKAQAFRFIAAHVALDMIYGPDWIVMALLLKLGVFKNTSVGILLGSHLLTGLSLSSFSVFIASFFKKSQLSGICAVIACLLLGVIAQTVPMNGNGAVIVLSILFPPMTYVFFLITMAHWEQQNLPMDLVRSAPNAAWTVSGIVFWVLFVIQIIFFPVLAAYVERLLYGTRSASRKVCQRGDSTHAISIDGLSKTYQPNWFARHMPFYRGNSRAVEALKSLTLGVTRGQILVLLGANGSGKSTTLDAIAGLTKPSSGHVSINNGDEIGGFGLCPQKNVLWDTLTVAEHIRVFNRLKSKGQIATEQEIRRVIKDCDLENKRNARAATLSGGQKRKLQLALMFTGGSNVCCVDEVSSGLDPISRRKIWDILLAERGSRTILLTTHFLDEADLLADYIAILARGTLRAEGSSVELKQKFGMGYRIHLPKVEDIDEEWFQTLDGVRTDTDFDETVLAVDSPVRVPELISLLENRSIKEYRVSGPTIEDVFLRVAQADTVPGSDPAADFLEKPHQRHRPSSPNGADSSLQLLTGNRVWLGRQALVLFRKRLTVLQRNYLPHLIAFLAPIVGAGLVSLYLKNYALASCTGSNAYSIPQTKSLLTQDFEIVLGPADKLSANDLTLYVNAVSPVPSSFAGAYSNLTSHVHLVDTYLEFTNFIQNNFGNVTPGGLFLGDTSSTPTFAWLGDASPMSSASIVQNAIDIFLTNISISTQYQPFDVPWQPDVGQPLQLITYFGLVMAIYPALFALYPTLERLNNIRASHYSNGVRSAPLWSAYLFFDFLFALLSTALTIIVFRAVSDVWYNLGYLFVVYALYGLASIALAYVISLFTKSQLAAFAFAAGGQCVIFLLYFAAYMAILTYAPVPDIDSDIKLAHFTIAAISPMGNYARAMYIALNLFSVTCDGFVLASDPGAITLYGGPILYLIVQFLVLFAFLVWYESGTHRWTRLGKIKAEDLEEKERLEKEIVDEVERTSNSEDGLRVLHLSKAFGKFIAVGDVTFGVPRGEVFALLGPNGAGKTTTISLIRGDMQPSRTSTNDTNILVENISVLAHRGTARQHLGVCPQFDALDYMTVAEHLHFYASIRGVSDPKHNVNEILQATGLTAYADKIANTLSGGTKRKLSLGIALIGNPTVLLLDEPSSGMDAASKRVMWQNLASIVPGRSIVLTTHSMEEADALAHRAGIMKNRMVALGSPEYLRRKYGNRWHVHLVHKDAPHTSPEHMNRIREWVELTFSDVEIEEKTYHGQMRFSVQAGRPLLQQTETVLASETPADRDVIEVKEARTNAPTACSSEDSAIGILFKLLEECKEDLGIQYYTINQTSLDGVFLRIVGRDNEDTT